MDYLESYFYTDTIYEHKHLLSNDAHKQTIINSWKYLIELGKIKVYAFSYRLVSPPTERVSRYRSHNKPKAITLFDDRKSLY